MTTPYLGQITMFAGTFAPVGWALCNGQLLSIAQNSALFQVLGTTYGGDGVQTFALPDLQCRIPVHQGAGLGLSPYVLGQRAGSENVTLLTAQMPQHSHSFNATTTNATATAIGSTLLPGVPTMGANPSLYTLVTTTTPTFNTMAAASCGPAGGNQPHPNQMPSLAISFIIALAGVFPSQ